MSRAKVWVAALAAAGVCACSGSNPLVSGSTGAGSTGSSGTVQTTATGATSGTGTTSTGGTGSTGVTSGSLPGTTAGDVGGPTGSTTGTRGTTSTSSTSTTTTTGGSTGTTTTSSGSSTGATTTTGGTTTSGSTTGTSTSTSTSTTGTSGTGTLHATPASAPSGGWQMVTGPSTVRDASADAAGNIWIAGGQDGIYVLRAGSSSLQKFGLGDGLHPYGYPSTGSVTQVYLNAISIAGGTAGHAYVGYDGQPGCEDEWDQNASNPDPNIYKSGDADHVWLSGSGIGVAHYDIYTGPHQVEAGDQSPQSDWTRGREKICTIYRIAYDGAHGNIWVGANHGFAWLNPTWQGSPAYTGVIGTQVLQEHIHPAINGYTTDNAPPQNDWLLSGGYYGVALVPSGDVWIGGIYRTYRCAGGNVGQNFWSCESDALNPASQVDIWPDAVKSDAYPSQRTDDYVMGLAVMGDGSLWAASRHMADDGTQTHVGLGLAHLSASGAVIGTLTDALPAHLTALAADPNGTLWVGSDQGVYRYDPSAGVVYKFGSDAVGGFSGSYVSNIQVDTHSSPRRVLVSFRSGALGIYTGN